MHVYTVYIYIYVFVQMTTPQLDATNTSRKSKGPKEWKTNIARIH